MCILSFVSFEAISIWIHIHIPFASIRYTSYEKSQNNHDISTPTGDDIPPKNAAEHHGHAHF